MTADADSKPLRVLIIDDDEDFKASVRVLLEGQGYTVFAADSAREGLAALATYEPDAILLDVMMEDDFAGYGVSQAIRHKEELARFRTLPIIMVSSVPVSPDERFAMSGDVGMIRPDIYLTKPLNIPEFLGILSQATRQRRPGQATA